MAINSIDIGLEGKNRARLLTRKWEKDYTNIPNSALPAQTLEGLKEIFKFLSGEELSLEDYTFLVRANQGKLKKVFSPVVFFNPDSSGLLIKWGDVRIPLQIKDGALAIPNQKGKYGFKIKTMPVNGYDNVVVSLSFTKDGTTYAMPFPVRAASIEAGLTEEELEVAIENEDTTTLSTLIALPPSGDDSNKEYSGSGKVLEGPVIKMVALPTGSYAITAFRRYKNSYGFQHLMQTSTEVPFKAAVSSKDEAGNWSVEEKEIVGPFILKANSATNKKLLGDPVITEESPATLTVIGEDEYNGHKFVKTELEVVAYTADTELLSLNF